MWAIDHYRALLQQWRRWKGVPHGAGKVLPAINCLAGLLRPAERTPFALAVSAEVVRLGRPGVQAYRLYYASAKRHLSVWSRSGPPVWWEAACREVAAEGLPVSG